MFNHSHLSAYYAVSYFFHQRADQLIFQLIHRVLHLYCFLNMAIELVNSCNVTSRIFGIDVLP